MIAGVRVRITAWGWNVRLQDVGRTGTIERQLKNHKSRRAPAYRVRLDNGEIRNVRSSQLTVVAGW